MKKLLLPSLFLGLLAAACTDNSQQAQANKEKELAHKVAQIAWKDLSYTDTLTAGDSATYSYVFYNTGWKPVRIKQALSSSSDCVCTGPAQPVPIGEQDTIKVKCHFPDPGRQGINILVEHDTPQKEFLLILFAEVQPKP